MKKLQLRLLSVLCLAALLIACLPAAYAYGVCSAWAKPELDQMSELSLIPQVLEEKPNLWDSITRLEMCAIAVQAYEVYTGEEIPLPEEAPFSDTQDPIAGKAYAAGLTQGYEDGTFRPDRLLTRQEVFAFVDHFFRAFGRAPAETDLSDLSAFSDASAMLMNGQVAMVIDGGWALANYTNEGFDVGVAPIPAFKHPADISWTAGLCMSPNAADNKEAFDFYQYFTNFTNSIQAALDQGVSLGGLPHTLEVFDGGENEAKWVSTYTKVDATQMCEAFKNILQADTTVLGDNVRVKNFPVIVDNTIVPALDNVWLGEVSAKEALEALDLSDSIDGYWK